eukprot:1004160-Heterocapsa_arctica.AAC.1
MPCQWAGRAHRSGAHSCCGSWRRAQGVGPGSRTGRRSVGSRGASRARHRAGRPIGEEVVQHR